MENLAVRETLPNAPGIQEKDEDFEEYTSYHELLTATPDASSTTIITPRDYQKALIQFCISQNAIVFLDTGLGKTLVAIYVIKNLFNEDINENKINLSAGDQAKPEQRLQKKAFFVVKTRNLVAQHAKNIDKLTKLRVGQYHAESEVQYLRYHRWREELRKKDVFVIIDKILLEILRHGIMRIEEIDLLIFDECHHTEKLSDYNLIMQEYYFHKWQTMGSLAKRPKIVGLTASPIKSDIKYKDIKASLQILSNHLNAAIAPLPKEQFPDIASHHVVTIKTFSLDEGKHDVSLKFCQTILKKVSIAYIDTLFLCENEKIRLKDDYDKYIKESISSREQNKGEGGRQTESEAWRSYTNRRKKLEPVTTYYSGENSSTLTLLNILLRKSLLIAKEIGSLGLYEYLSSFCSKNLENNVSNERLLKIINNAGKILIDQISSSHDKNKLQFVSNKVKAIYELLMNSASPMSSIIFCDERLIAHILLQVFLRHFPTLPAVAHVMGHTFRSHSTTKNFYKNKYLSKIGTIAMPSEEQLKNIALFRERKINILIATDVVEEGMDIPSCNLVICFNEIKNVKSYIQMQGRAREENARFVLICNETEKLCMERKIIEFDRVIKMAKEMALESKDAIIKPEPDIHLKFALKEQDYLEVPETGAKICRTNSRSFLKRYCQSLPIDEYCPTRLIFEFETTPIMGGQLYLAKVVLPPMVPKAARYGRGTQPRPSKIEAEDDVAFLMINQLYKIKKLNANLLSTSRYGSIMLSKMLKEDVDEEKKFNAKPTAAGRLGVNDSILDFPINKIKEKLCKIEIKEESKEKFMMNLFLLELDPEFPFLKQDHILGGISESTLEELKLGKVKVIIDNTNSLNILDAINEKRKKQKGEKEIESSQYDSVVTKSAGPLANKIRFLQANAEFVPIASNSHEKVQISTSIEVTLMDYMKIKFFHLYSLYLLMSADYAFFKRIASGKDDFSQVIFSKELQALKNIMKEKNILEDSNFVNSCCAAAASASKTSENTFQVSIHFSFAPLKRTSTDILSYSIDYGMIDSLIQNYKNLILFSFASEIVNPLQADFSAGNMIETFYNKAKYSALQKSCETMHSKMTWVDRKRRKHWLLTYWDYYNIRYKYDVNLAGSLIQAMPLGTIPSRILRQSINCFVKSQFDQCRTGDEKNNYLNKLALQFVETVQQQSHPYHGKSRHSARKKKPLFEIAHIPEAVARVFPYPLELFEEFKITPIILTVMSSIYGFRVFQENFFGKIFCSHTIEKFALGQIVKKEDQIGLNGIVKLALIAEALTSGSAQDGYDYQRLEFLGDTVLGLLEAWDSFMLKLEADVGELKVERVYKLGNKNLSNIAISYNLDKALKFQSSKSAYSNYVPPGLSQSEYIEIGTIKCNMARNLIAFFRSKSNRPYLSEDFSKSRKKKEEEKARKKSLSAEEHGQQTNESCLKYDDEDKRFAKLRDMQLDSQPAQEGDPAKAVSVPEQEVKTENDQKEIAYNENQEIEILQKEEEKRKANAISPKMYADTVESLAAAVSLSHGIHAAEQYLKYIGLIGVDKYRLEEVKSGVIIEEKIAEGVSREKIKGNLAELESKLKFKFRNYALLRSAFVHASYLWEMPKKGGDSYKYWEAEEKQESNMQSYQRLQYLGNAAIEYIVAHYLYSSYSEANPCLLHKLKICCLNNQLFCVIAVDLDLDQYLYYSQPKLDSLLIEYKYNLGNLRQSSQTKYIDLDELDHCYVKLLSDSLEAVVGVIMLETQNIEKVEQIIMPIFEPYFKAYATPTTFKEHPKCFLFELVALQKGALRKLGHKKFETLNKEGFFVTVYRGFLGDVLVAEQECVHDSFIVEKNFFKFFYGNVKKIIEAYHERKKDGFGEYYLMINTIIEDLNLEIRNKTEKKQGKQNKPTMI